MSVEIMSASEAYEKTSKVLKEQNRIERELAEGFIQNVFVPALSEAIARGRCTTKLSITPDVNAYVVSNILRENGYKTRVSCGRNGVGRSSVIVFWNPEEEDNF